MKKSLLKALPLSILSVGISAHAADSCISPKAADNCNGFTDGMTCFQENTPALANEVNANFQTVLALLAKKSGPGNVSYTRWGRTECPDSASLIYKGYAASGNYASHGAIVSQLCLTDDPKYPPANMLNSTSQPHGARLYGTEYETSTSGIEALKLLHDKDAPCAVCLKPQATVTLMIPGTIECPANWNKEYQGYVMSNHHPHAGPKEAVCVDIEPESRLDTATGKVTNRNGNLWYTTETECGSLPCPPYTQDLEVSCVVCTY